MEKRKRKTPSSQQQVLKTRVCIKNLPASLQDGADLKQYILDRLPDARITDCRILKHAKSGKSRRMAFCGFSTEVAAQACINQLHKAYCQSARLLVEYAVAVETTDEVNQETKEETKKKEEEIVPVTKKQTPEPSFVVKPGKKRSFWANDDDDNKNDAHAPQEPPPESSGESDSSDDDASDEDSLEDNADPLGAKSDLDFLKSKQVAVDDFTEGNDEPPMMKDEASNGDNQKESEGVKLDDDKNDSDEQANEEEESSSERLSQQRLFVRNLPFSVTEDDLREHFEPFGTVSECHIPADDFKRSKGFGFVSMEKPDDAQAALQQLDGTDFQGRLLHVLPARQQQSRPRPVDPQGGYKQKLEAERQSQALTQKAGWSASHVRGDAVVDSLADRLGLRKGDVMAVKDGLSGGDAAVRLALAETAIIEENRQFFARHGYDMEALVSSSSSGNNKLSPQQRSKVAILVKNLPHDTAKDELLQVFSSKGAEPNAILLPPSRTLAVIEYGHGNDAKSAFKRLAFRRFKSVPLYLEWAPLAAITNETKDAEAARQGKKLVDSDQLLDAEETEETEESTDPSLTPTLYIKNLNFATTEEKLLETVSQVVKEVRSARIPQKRGTSTSQSMGYGFVEFASGAAANRALKLLNGKLLDGHALDIKHSTATTARTAPVPVTSKKNTKLAVRNVPFQADRQELMQLFGSFGHLKRVRVPKKFDGTNRGYAFVEYLTHKEAAAAMKALSRTHLYGRHLVLEWASTDEQVNQMDVLRSKAHKDVAPPPPNKKIRFD